MANHTPGPWHTGGKNGSIIYSGGYAVANAETFHGRHDGETQAANARLIAEAPAMLDLLASIHELGRCSPHDTPVLWAAIEATITKSLGAIEV